jgi:hypothetical protein
VLIELFPGVGVYMPLMSGIDAVTHCVMIATSVAFGCSLDWTIWGTRSLPICAPTQIVCSIFMARMVTTNSFITVTVGCCAVGVVIVCVVVGIVVGTVVIVVAAGGDIPQLLLMLAISANNRKIRIMEVSLIARFTQ